MITNGKLKQMPHFFGNYEPTFTTFPLSSPSNKILFDGEFLIVYCRIEGNQSMDMRFLVYKRYEILEQLINQKFNR